MFKKIKLFKKLMSIVDVIENFFDKHDKEHIEKARKALPEIKGYVTDFERLLERIGDK